MQQWITGSTPAAPIPAKKDPHLSKIQQLKRKLGIEESNEKNIPEKKQKNSIKEKMNLFEKINTENDEKS